MSLQTLIYCTHYLILGQERSLTDLEKDDLAHLIGITGLSDENVKPTLKLLEKNGIVHHGKKNPAKPYYNIRLMVRYNLCRPLSLLKKYNKLSASFISTTSDTRECSSVT